MTFLPIVERELRVRARLKSTYRFRVAGALVAMLVVGFMLVVSAGLTSPDKFGKTIFQVLSWLAFIYCLIEGLRNTADCLSEEKRGGTLGLLFLTDLKGYDVVLGKLMATSLNSFYALLAVLPLIAAPLLLGGVTAGEFWRLCLVLVNTLFLSLAIGMCVSAISHQERRAWGGALLILLCLNLYPLLSDLVSFLPSTLAYFGPSLAFASFWDAPFNTAPHLYWNSVLCMHGLALALLIAASFLLPRAWQESDAGPGIFAGLGRVWAERLPQPSRSRALMQQNPMLWLAGRQGQQQLVIWIVIGGAALIATICAMATSWSLAVGKALLWSGLALHFVMATWAGVKACFVFGEGRDSGALELLLGTALTVREIVQGQFLAIRNIFLAPVAALLLAEIGLVLAFLFRLGPATVSPAAEVLVLALVAFAIIFFILDLYAAAWFGLWMGLISKKSSQAVVRTTLLVLVLPLVCGAPCFMLWPVLGLVKDLILINYAQEQIHRRFRLAITERFISPVEGEAASILDGPGIPPRLPPVLP